MTENKRFTIMITPEIEERIRNLRKTDKFCMMSISDIVRTLINSGLDVIADNPHLTAPYHGRNGRDKNTTKRKETQL